jgi:hypothetical protein
MPIAPRIALIFIPLSPSETRERVVTSPALLLVIVPKGVNMCVRLFGFGGWGGEPSSLWAQTHALDVLV